MSVSRVFFKRALALAILSTGFLPSVLSSSPPAIQVYFSPEGKIAEQLIALIDQEPSSIKSAVYCFMHTEIAKALNRACERGVKVELIIDPYSVKTRSPVGRMEGKGIAVHVWDPEAASVSHRSLMHDKFCIFGEHTVFTGSFNFTKQAAVVNRENVVVIRDSAIAKLYLQEFQKIKKAGCRPYRQFLALKTERKQLALK